MRDIIFFIITSILIIGLFGGGIVYHFSIVDNLTGEVSYINTELSTVKKNNEQQHEQQQKTIQEQAQQINQLGAELSQRTGQLETQLNKNTQSLIGYVDTAKKQSQQQFSQLTGQIQQVEKTALERTKDLEQQLSNLEISPDFSNIIRQAILSAVSVQTEKSIGSGSIISRDGYIVTNAHVIEGANTITVKTFEGHQYAAQIIGQNTSLDIAVLKIGGDFNYLHFANSDDVILGEKVIAVGSPLGLEFTVTEGIISSTNRYYNGINYFQTDVPINPGNSGGPLVNKLGQIVGINSKKVAEAEGLGFAIKSNQVKSILENFVDI